jgi:hypothetical protein
VGDGIALQLTVRRVPEEIVRVVTFLRDDPSAFRLLHRHLRRGLPGPRERSTCLPSSPRHNRASV